MYGLVQRSVTMSAICLAALLASAGPVPAQSRATLSADDRAFMRKASEGNFGEIAAGSMAEQRGASEAVRLLGQRYADNHRTNEQQLSMVAQRLGVPLPRHPGAEDQAQMERLMGLSGAAFDSAFVHAEEQDHVKTIAAFKAERDSTENPLLAAYVRKSLPVLEEHLQMATDDAARLHRTRNSGGGTGSL